MHIRKTLFALGVFFFGVGIMFSGGGVQLGGISYANEGHILGISYWIVPAIISFLIAAILLAWSLTE